MLEGEWRTAIDGVLWKNMRAWVPTLEPGHLCPSRCCLWRLTASEFQENSLCTVPGKLSPGNNIEKIWFRLEICSGLLKGLACALGYSRSHVMEIKSVIIRTSVR